MNRLRSSNGMTLIEIIIALAILGIIVIAFLNMFTFGYTQVIKAGHKTTAVFMAHQAAEQTIAGITPAPNIVTSVTYTMTINLPNPPPTTMMRTGRKSSFTTENGGKNAKVTTFIP